MSKGKFQFNMEFLQWLYDYAHKQGAHLLQAYSGYERRVDAFKKQQNIPQSTPLGLFYLNMSPHLIPNQSLLQINPTENDGSLIYPQMIEGAG